MAASTDTAISPETGASVVETDDERERWWQRVGLYWWAVPGALIGALVFLTARHGLIDDTYITLGYVRNVARDLHWGLIPTEEANTATSPLNVIMLTLATWAAALLTGGDIRPVLGLGILTVVLSGAMSVWSAQISRRVGVGTAWSLAVLAIVFSNPFLNSALGLEVVPIAALTIGLVAQAVRGRRVAFGVLAGLLVLTRLDMGVIVAVLYLLTPEIRRRFWVAPVTALLVALPWYAFSWWHFGSAIPTTFVIKTLQRSFGDVTFANGLWTWWPKFGALPLAIALVPGAVGVLTVLVLLVRGVRGRLPSHLWPVAALGVGGAAYYGAYTLLQVPSYQWYYVPTTVTLAVTGVFGLALLLRQTVPAGDRRIVRLVGPLVTAGLVGGLTLVTLTDRGIPWDHPVYFAAWALPGEYREVGAAVGAEIGDATVMAPPEIGTVAYACDCSMVDLFSDPGITLPLVEKRLDEAGPVSRWLLDLNFTRLDRDEEPRPAQYRLVWTQESVPPGVLMSWPTNGPVTGPATMYLERIG